MRWQRWDWLLLGLRNVRRWAPVIWDDVDWDWASLARIAEHKLRLMAESSRSWPTRDAERCRREMLVCAELLRRLWEDEYLEARHEYQDGHELTLEDYRLVDARSKHEQRLLGKILGTRMRTWWS